MKKKLHNTLFVMAFIPLLAMSTFELNTVPIDTVNTNNNNITDKAGEKLSAQDIQRKEEAEKIDNYFKQRSMPLAGHGEQFVVVAEKYGLPYNLLPAIAIRESSGGKYLINNNPFGWGSAKIKFSSFNEAIEAVGRNLGGANPRTAAYYSGNTIRAKLYNYNGTVIKGYEDQVIAIMNRIDTKS
jgi:hypothetical protein